MGEGFTWDTQDRARDIAAARAAWELATAMIADPSYRMVLLDELNIVLRYGYLPLDAGLARVFTRRGLKVRPFKPQNMSSNAAVTAEGGEIGRAQGLQARACGAPPAIDMNPVLLKPQTDGMAQLIVCGRVHSALSARGYRALAPSLLPQVLAAFHRLAVSADLILVEGAGSPAEINLRQGDIANMG